MRDDADHGRRDGGALDGLHPRRRRCYSAPALLSVEALERYALACTGSFFQGGPSCAFQKNTGRVLTCNSPCNYS